MIFFLVFSTSSWVLTLVLARWGQTQNTETDFYRPAPWFLFCWMSWNKPNPGFYFETWVCLTYLETPGLHECLFVQNIRVKVLLLQNESFRIQHIIIYSPLLFSFTDVTTNMLISGGKKEVSKSNFVPKSKFKTCNLPLFQFSVWLDCLFFNYWHWEL